MSMLHNYEPAISFLSDCLQYLLSVESCLGNMVYSRPISLGLRAAAANGIITRLHSAVTNDKWGTY